MNNIVITEISYIFGYCYNTYVFIYNTYNLNYTGTLPM